MNRTDYDAQEDSDGIHKKTAFILEGVLLLVIAVIGLTGNLLAIVTILSQKVLKIFHDLLLVLTVFDMVCKKLRLSCFREKLHGDEKGEE